MSVNSRLSKLEKARPKEKEGINVEITKRDTQGNYLVEGQALTPAEYMQDIEERRAAGETIVTVGFELDKV